MCELMCMCVFMLSREGVYMCESVCVLAGVCIIICKGM